MLYISITFTLFALMAGMLLLAKTKKEELGSFFKWISYLVILISLLMLICQGTRGVMRMICRTRLCPPSENCMPEMMNKEYRHGGMMMHHGRMGMECCGGGMMMGRCCMDMDGGKCVEEMRECEMKGDSASCNMNMKHGCPMMDEEKEEKKMEKKPEKK